MTIAERVSVTQGGPISLCLPDLREVHQAELRAAADDRVAEYRKSCIAEHRQNYAASAIVMAVGVAAVEMGIHDAKTQFAVALASIGGTALTFRNWYKKDIADVEIATARKRSLLESEV
jgi:hypothetical protein